MDKEAFLSMADSLAREAGVAEGAHQYFRNHQSRLWETGRRFGLWELRGRRVLDVGPFYSYVPFALAAAGNTLSVLEGPDPAVRPLEALYARRGIALHFADLFDVFQSARPEARRLPFAGGEFDVVNCWETMEHFNFNPVGFVREVRRLLKPGGHACITTPNMAALQSRLWLLLGRSVRTPVAHYRHYFDYADGRFLGFHWREYVLGELVELFRTEGFEIVHAGHLQTYQDREGAGFLRRASRAGGAAAAALLPSLGNLCCLHVRRPHD